MAKSIPYLFNVSGPYAVGKDSILNELISRYGNSVHRVRTITTRPVSAEADPTYEQVTAEEFQLRIGSGQWIANYQLSGLTAYATSIDEIYRMADQGIACILSVYAGPEGAGRLKQVFGRNAYSIGLLPAAGTIEHQLQVLRDRLLARNRDNPQAIDARLRHQLQPLQYVIDNPTLETSDGMLSAFDDVLVNGELDETVKGVANKFETIFQWIKR